MKLIAPTLEQHVGAGEGVVRYDECVCLGTSGVWTAQIPKVEHHPMRAVPVRLYPLNPNDLPASAELRLFDLVSMRPTSLVENATIRAEQWWTGEHPRRGQFALPGGMSFRVEAGKN